MGFGVAIPLEFNARGGLRTTEDNLFGLIAAGLLPGDTDNPYDVRDGLVEVDPTFEPITPATVYAQMARVRRTYRRLEAEGRARLDDVYQRQREGVDTGELEIFIKWENLETGQTNESVLRGGVGELLDAQ